MKVFSASVERVVFLAAAVVVGRDGGVMMEGRSIQSELRHRAPLQRKKRGFVTVEVRGVR